MRMDESWIMLDMEDLEVEGRGVGGGGRWGEIMQGNISRSTGLEERIPENLGLKPDCKEFSTTLSKQG